MGVLTCKVCGELTASELDELRDWWSGQESGCKGECIYETIIKWNDCTFKREISAWHEDLP